MTAPHAPSLFILAAATAVLASIATAVTAAAEPRTWTSTDGKTLEAEFLRVSGDDVLVSRDGRTVSIPLVRLSEADREWVTAQKESKYGSGDAGPDEAAIARVTELLERSLESADLTDEERDEVVSFVERLLPDKGADGEPIEWDVRFPKWGGDGERDSVLLSADLFRKGEAEDGDRRLWIHVVFFGEKRDITGSEKFEGYPAMRFESRHLFVTANRTDVRAVASDESYQDDRHIDAVMKGIDLETFSKL